MLIVILAIFLLGYFAIALEHPLKVDKTAIALLLGMLLWAFYAYFSPVLVPLGYGADMEAYAARVGLTDATVAEKAMAYMLNVQIVYHVGEITQTLFFLIGAMTIVELIDVHEGFSVITNKITTKRKRLLLVVVCLLTFFLSAALDNLTTTIVMLMVLRKLIAHKRTRWIFASMVVIAANTGGAWSPIGDVTTIMLWVHGNVTSQALISFVLLPSLVALLVPLAIVAANMHGNVVAPIISARKAPVVPYKDRRLILILGVAGLLLVPVFKSITHLPPFICVLFSLGLLWTFTECFYNGKKMEKKYENRISTVVKRIDMSTILFFLGILMAVAVLQSSGILRIASQWLDANVHNVYAIDLLLGVLSSIVDNVPLVSAAMGMYPISVATATGYAANFMVDGTFWEFLSYCAGVGGSILIIGSAAGVVAMGIEKIEFGWYLRRFSLIALAGYLAGAFLYFAQTEWIRPLF